MLLRGRRLVHNKGCRNPASYIGVALTIHQAIGVSYFLEKTPRLLFTSSREWHVCIYGDRVIRVFGLVDKNRMPQFCCVPGCSNCTNREKHLSYHCLPLKRKAILKAWTHKIGRKYIPLNDKMRVWSEHFLNSRGRQLRRDEVPSLNLPLLSTRVTEPTPQRAVVRHVQENDCDAESETSPGVFQNSPGVVDNSSVVEYRDIGVNTDLTMYDIETKERKVNELTSDLDDTKLKLQSSCFVLKMCVTMTKNLGFIRGLPPFQHYWFALISLVQQWMNSRTNHLDNKTNINLPKDETELYLH